MVEFGIIERRTYNMVKLRELRRKRVIAMLIRPAHEGDAQGIAHVHTESWKTTYRGIVPDDFLDHLTIESRLPSGRRASVLAKKIKSWLLLNRSMGTLSDLHVGVRSVKENYLMMESCTLYIC